MIKRLSVIGLNNRIDDDLVFKEDLNIITGKNGSGKTTVLKLLWYLISGNLERAFREIPFHSVSVETDSFSLCVEHVDSGRIRVEFTIPSETDSTEIFEMPLKEYGQKLHVLNGRIARMMKSSLFFPTFRRIEGGFAEMDPSFFSGVEEFHYERPGRTFVERATDQLQGAMSRLSDGISVFDHKFIVSISTHDIVDLLRGKHTEITDETNDLHVQLSKEIAQKISETKESDNAALVLKDIESLIDKATIERNLILRPLTVLSRRVVEILQYKRFSISSEITFGETEEAITSDKLSSGEKQMLSFLCYNAFSENTTIFIDEPELSLHVDWQRLLLPTLLEQATGNQFIFATHSPFIYAKYPEKEHQLAEDRGDN
ncbi:MAG: AAA family ATPase [Caldilineaceae bacterium]|nr:AAA family ATPase [Caldilineaceae bacterium]